MENMTIFNKVKADADALERGQICEFATSFGRILNGAVVNVDKLDEYTRIIHIINNDGIGGLWVRPSFLSWPREVVTNIIITSR